MIFHILFHPSRTLRIFYANLKIFLQRKRKDIIYLLVIANIVIYFISYTKCNDFYQSCIMIAITDIRAVEAIDTDITSAVPDTAIKLQAYLSTRNPALVQHAEYIVKLPRWRLAIGIISQETNFCHTGVGASRNNCGAIKNGSGAFKHYNNHLDSIEDVTILLQHDRYRDKSISEINGVYCQDANRPGRKCAGWTEQVTKIVQELS